jgi:hypothetical protein
MTVLIADGTGYGRGPWVAAPYDTPPYCVDPRHFGKANTLFLDYHVERLEVDEIGSFIMRLLKKSGFHG